MTRGIRNNNPLNIRLSMDKWQGQVLPSPNGEGTFCQFQTMEYGIRAAFCLLRTYATKYRLNSVRDIITRWAPPSENDTQRYIRHVCILTGFGGNQRLTKKDWPRLVKAMAKIESGAELDDELIQRAWRLFTH
jgi:hypothetical protein